MVIEPLDEKDNVPMAVNEPLFVMFVGFPDVELTATDEPLPMDRPGDCTLRLELPMMANPGLSTTEPDVADQVVAPVMDKLLLSVRFDEVEVSATLEPDREPPPESIKPLPDRVSAEPAVIDPPTTTLLFTIEPEVVKAREPLTIASPSITRFVTLAVPATPTGMFRSVNPEAGTLAAAIVKVPLRAVPSAAKVNVCEPAVFCTTAIHSAAVSKSP
jgi:hypothetical protein